MTQHELAKLLSTSISVVGKYKRDKITPSVEVAKKMAQLLETTVDYLLGEVIEADTFKDPIMFKRLQDIILLPIMTSIVFYILLMDCFEMLKPEWLISRKAMPRTAMPHLFNLNFQLNRNMVSNK